MSNLSGKTSNLKRKRRRQSSRSSYYDSLKAKQIQADCMNMEFQKQKALILIKRIIENYKESTNAKITNLFPRLHTEQIIYVIYNMQDTLRYIGQSNKDAIHRFMEHLQTAKRIANSELLKYTQSRKQKLLYTHMLKTGLDIWRIYPIENIETDKLECFKQLATERELFWIKYFNTLTPYGLNMNLPIATEKVQLPVLPPETEGKVKDQNDGDFKSLVPYKRRRYDSRNYTRKIQLLNRLMLADNFKCNTLDRYTVKHLQAMLCHLENINAEQLKIPKHTAQTLRTLIKCNLLKPQTPIRKTRIYRFILKLSYLPISHRLTRTLL